MKICPSHKVNLLCLLPSKMSEKLTLQIYSVKVNLLCRSRLLLCQSKFTLSKSTFTLSLSFPNMPLPQSQFTSVFCTKQFPLCFSFVARESMLGLTMSCASLLLSVCPCSPRWVNHDCACDMNPLWGFLEAHNLACSYPKQGNRFACSLVDLKYFKNNLSWLTET